VGVVGDSHDPPEPALSQGVHPWADQGPPGQRLDPREGDPTEMITTEVPEWRIVDDAIWFAVNERFTARGPL
jgi:hypothetical protein